MAPIKTIEHFRVPPRWLFVKVTDDQGRSGWGEASLEGHSEAVEGCLDAFAERFVGMEADEIEHIWQSGYRMGFYRGGPVLMSALAGVDIALWDLKARNAGLPIYQLLGGKVRSKLRVYAWIGGDRPNDVKAQAEARMKQGFSAIKMNATEDIGWLDSPSKLDAAVERLKTVKALGTDAGVDFHGRIHKPMAHQLAAKLAPHEPLFIEEPLLSENPEGIAALAQLTTIPIALGERLHSRWDMKPYLGTVSIFQPDISHVGGISELRRMAVMAEAYDAALAPHCPLGPIALAANVQVDAVSANFAIQEMSLGIHYNTQAGDKDLTNYIKQPEVWDVQDGYIDVPDGIGLGIEIDEEEVRAAAVGAKSWRSPAFRGFNGEWREW